EVEDLPERETVARHVVVPERAGLIRTVEDPHPPMALRRRDAGALGDEVKVGSEAPHRLEVLFDLRFKRRHRRQNLRIGKRELFDHVDLNRVHCAPTACVGRAFLTATMATKSSSSVAHTVCVGMIWHFPEAGPRRASFLVSPESARSARMSFASATSSG